MSDLPETVAAPVKYTLGGHELEFGLLTLADLARFERWVRNNRRREALGGLSDMVTPKEKTELLHKLVFSPDPIDLTVEMASIEGVVQLLLISRKKVDPSVTEEQIGSLLRVNDLPEIQLLVNILVMGGMWGEEDDEEGQGGDAADPPDSKEPSPGEPKPTSSGSSTVGSRKRSPS